MVLAKQGFFFTFDALLASVILLGMLMIITKYYIQEQDISHMNYLSQDITTTFNTLKTVETNNDWVKAKIADGNITNTDFTITEQIGQFWAEGETELANQICEEMTQGLVEENLGYAILVNNEWICGRNKTNDQTIISSRKMVSGIEKYKPTEGIVAQAHLTSIGSKLYSSYLYFGGFTGQGNISGYIDEIPPNSTLQDMKIEVDAASDFDVYINNQKCDGTFSASEGNMTADKWNITSCIGNIISGQRNNFTLSFYGDISQSYLGGGFIKIEYLTDQMVETAPAGTKIKKIPGIDGIINLYDSIYIPGELNNMTIKLHYKAQIANVTNNTFYMTIGNTKVLRVQNPDGEETITLTDAQLKQNLSYSSLGLKTVPIRIGFENVTFGYLYIGQADVAIITDLSGSMNWRMDIDRYSGTRRNCDSSSLGDPSTQRLSVAKCIDKNFARNVLNITGNKVGLIAYATSTQTGSTLYPAENITIIDSRIGTAVPQTGYIPLGSTCICCGINSATDMLINNITKTTLIAKGSTGWMYTTDYLKSEPLIDSMNNTWYNITYQNETSWNNEGTAPIGATGGYSYSPTIATEIGGNITGNISYADLWENIGDTTGAPNDFSSGLLNYTANTYGISGADDGWDWDTQNGAGPLGYDDNIDYNQIVSGKLELDCRTGSPARNRCSGYDCSGAYGIKVNITQQMWDVISSAGGSATLSFNYEWADTSGNNFETSDQVWVKARWTSPTTGTHYIGRNLDYGQDGADTDPEVATADNPDTDFSGFFAEDLSNNIEGPGMYYIELGGKIYASSYNEHGTWRFDNIQIAITNSTNKYYFRKHFTITNISKAQRGALNILSDDKATVYINGWLIDEDYESHTGEYWNRRGINVPGSYLQQGDNVIAVELTNTGLAAKLDIELLGFDNPRDKAMAVMTDGEANVECSRQSTGDPKQDAIKAACDARENYGIIVYAVGFSDSAEENTLREIAECGGGVYLKSNNVTVLEEFYEDIASQIISASRHSQTISIQGEMTDTILYDDSYIEINYTPIVEPAQFGEISLIFEQNSFKNCTFNVSIPEDVRVIDSKITSYSSEHWTDGLIVNGNIIYNLSQYNTDYTTLGDPFIVNIPPTLLNPGDNTFTIRTGDHPENSTGCSLNNTFIYTGMVQSNIPYSPVMAKAEGCNWQVEFSGNGIETISAPADYTGSKSCSFTSTNISYDTEDTIDAAAHSLFDQLDFDEDNKVDINFNDLNLHIQSFIIPGVPSMWGPSIAEVRIW